MRDLIADHTFMKDALKVAFEFLFDNAKDTPAAKDVSIVSTPGLPRHMISLSKKIRCLIDTGSQRSYMSARVAKELCTDLDSLNMIDFNTASNKVQIYQCQKSSKVHDTSVNLILNPIKSYFNPLENILSDSDIENGIEYLFSLESIGISKNEIYSSEDQEQIARFNEAIQFKDGHYQVKLPWHSEKIELVPSNFQVARKVLGRVSKNLKKSNLYEKYEEVFDQQLQDGIIEQIEIDFSDEKVNNHTWIPHRPVIKMEEQVSTKIRPVFNCSLKTDKNLPSLNEAAYTGVDLMESLLKLLFCFRTNDIILLSDIKQAFLSIRLSQEFDKNRFCFLWERDKLIAYRYRTLVFGFTSSPFILHYVMKKHASKFPLDKCTDILSSQFYVDNLIFTGNNFKEMTDLYRLCYERMSLGGFILRSWNSNSLELRQLIEKDGKLVEHSNETEKILGYRFNPNMDEMQLAPVEFHSVSTKRQLLSETSSLFDPLGLVLPISIKGKLLMRKVQHMGVSTTLNFLRSQGFWIPKGRSSVKASIKDCKICQKYNALAYNYPKVTSMPKQHMNLIRPFNHVRIVKVKQNSGEIAFHTIKNLYPMELNITLGSQNPSQPSEDKEVSGSSGYQCANQSIIASSFSKWKDHSPTVAANGPWDLPQISLRRNMNCCLCCIIAIFERSLFTCSVTSNRLGEVERPWLPPIMTATLIVFNISGYLSINRGLPPVVWFPQTQAIGLQFSRLHQRLFIGSDSIGVIRP
ncbi:uncharacterized protein LOC143024532 [Oratosquilla oratoria]|uniref:uncharacterized protein LOC143024532 n=1 Tax=Oratosquilla oratoria TaxID=337810 RepID=UPI003F769ED4